MARPCPICRRAVPEDGPQAALRPFCSERCKTIDLGSWLDGTYRISRAVQEEDLDGGLPADVRLGDRLGDDPQDDPN